MKNFLVKRKILGIRLEEKRKEIPAIGKKEKDVLRLRVRGDQTAACCRCGKRRFSWRGWGRRQACAEDAGVAWSVRARLWQGVGLGAAEAQVDASDGAGGGGRRAVRGGGDGASGHGLAARRGLAR